MPEHSFEWSHFLISSPINSDWDFRSFDGGVLVGFWGFHFYANFPQNEPPLYSPDKYAINLSSGKVRRATERQWEQAERYVPMRDSTLRTIVPSERLIYRGKTFTRRGAKLPPSYEDAARASQDGAFLAVNGWDGIVGAEGSWDDPVLFGRDFSKGNYYVDVYDVNSATIAFSLTGHFSGVSSDPNGLFRASGWFSKRYYVFPLDRLQMNRFVVCDMNKINRHGNP
jgi:hypothetical protein